MELARDDGQLTVVPRSVRNLVGAIEHRANHRQAAPSGTILALLTPAVFGRLIDPDQCRAPGLPHARLATPLPRCAREPWQCGDSPATRAPAPAQ